MTGRKIYFKTFKSKKKLESFQFYFYFIIIIFYFVCLQHSTSQKTQLQNGSIQK